jgi:hypothetical protein
MDPQPFARNSKDVISGDVARFDDIVIFVNVDISVIVVIFVNVLKGWWWWFLKIWMAMPITTTTRGTLFHVGVDIFVIVIFVKNLPGQPHPRLQGLAGLDR